jgi:hypothetical protein
MPARWQPLLRDRRFQIGAGAALAVIVVIVAVLLSRGGGGSPAASSQPGANGEAEFVADTPFSALSPGDCIAGLPETYIYAVARVGCEEPHLLEVFALFDLAEAAPYPGDRAVADAADDGCVQRFDAYVGTPYLESELDVGHATPTGQTWDEEDDRTVICWTFARDGSLLSRSVADSRQ